MSRIATVACHFSRAHRVSFCYLDIRTLCRCFRGDDDRRAQPVRGQDLCHVVGLGHVRGVVWEFCGRGGLSLVDIILVQGLEPCVMPPFDSEMVYFGEGLGNTGRVSVVAHFQKKHIYK